MSPPTDPDAPDPALERRLSPDERRAVLDQALPGVFSTVSPAGWVHSVPVHFLLIDGEIRAVAEQASAKVANLLRTGRATLCVATTIDGERLYVTAEGPTRIEGLAQADLDALDRKYGTDSPTVDDDDFAGTVTLVLRPERWFGFADVD